MDMPINEPRAQESAAGVQFLPGFPHPKADEHPILHGQVHGLDLPGKDVDQPGVADTQIGYDIAPGGAQPALPSLEVIECEHGRSKRRSQPSTNTLRKVFFPFLIRGPARISKRISRAFRVENRNGSIHK